jgi:hypothetical protein
MLDMDTPTYDMYEDRGVNSQVPDIDDVIVLTPMIAVLVLK